MWRGSARFVTLTGEEMAVHAGDVFYLPRGLQYHSYWESDAETAQPAEWDSYGFSLFPCPTEAHYKMQILTCDAEALAELDRIKQDPTVSPSTIGRLFLFLGQLLPTMIEENPDPRAQLLAKARQYMRENPDFRVGALARACGISESGLYAFFRDYAGTTPIAMKNQMKVEVALDLLASTDLSIEEISDRLRFSSAAYFRKIVREQTGKTPSALRRENRGAHRL
jgi:AraC-like DNA-binding protein